jgi:phospholipid/cholesterol/gamma-HCH transport system ATP-binding protein
MAKKPADNKPAQKPPEKPADAAPAKRAASDTPLVEARGVHVQFGRNAVLRDINLKIPRGQTLAVIGESGCGKTVFLKTVIGLVMPSRGEMLIEGRNLATLSDKELTRERTRFGFVFQQAALFDSMTIAQNVTFPLRQHTQKSEAEMRDTMIGLLAEVGLPESVARKKPAELSGGMRKRVGLARALAMNPEIVLYDEPTTGLDPIMSDVINQLILRTREHFPVTSIIVTHDMNTARKVADRVVMFYPLARIRPDEPQIIFDGTPADLDRTDDPRVSQFVHGEARERLMEMQEQFDSRLGQTV